MNKETLQSYNTRLNTNNNSLDNILKNINSLPEVSGGVATTTNITELQQAIIDLENNFVQYCCERINKYPTYTTEAVTLYTPNEANKRYVIRKRGANQYQIVWFPDTILKYSDSSTINTIYYRIPQTKIDGMSVTVDTSILLYYTIPVDVYLSSDFTTTKACIQALQDPTTSYSLAGNDKFGSVMEGEYLVPYTNLPCDKDGVLIGSQRISSNETIEVIS